MPNSNPNPPDPIDEGRYIRPVPPPNVPHGAGPRDRRGLLDCYEFDAFEADEPELWRAAVLAQLSRTHVVTTDRYVRLRGTAEDVDAVIFNADRVVDAYRQRRRKTAEDPGSSEAAP